MQDNTQFAGYDAPQQGNPYDDQSTIPVQGYTPPASSYTQDAGPFAPVSEPPAPIYQHSSMPSGVVSSVAEPQKKRPVKKILIGGVLGLVLVLLGVGGGLLLARLAAPASNQAAIPTSAPISTPAPNAASVQKNIYTPYLARYRVPIRSQIALGLHLSADQLQTQLSSGQTLSSIASAQGVSSTQLQILVTNAFQSGFQPAVQSGNLTQAQVDTLIKRMLKQPQTLDRFLAVKTKAGSPSVATPTV
jgi:hypothetical protein